LNFVVWDEDDAYSPQGTCLINILPINDFPSIIKESTWCDLVRYQHYNKDKSDSGKEGCYRQVSFHAKGTQITVKDGDAAYQKALQGVTIQTKNTPSTGKSTRAVATEDDDKLLLINKCQTRLQDIDFTFGYTLNITGLLFKATFRDSDSIVDCDTGLSLTTAYVAKKRQDGGRTLTPVTKSQENPKTGKTDASRMSYSGDVNALNEFLAAVSFLIVIDAGQVGGFGLFKIHDYGNIDKWNRPLSTTFTIEFSAPIPLGAGAVPIAVIALLPIVAAAVSAIAAAAWLLLGSRAADAVTENFDAFAPTQAGQGNVSPCYNDHGWHAENPIH
jgi:hypothetical protein